MEAGPDLVAMTKSAAIADNGIMNVVANNAALNMELIVICSLIYF
jgi:hypothetical protein